MAVRRQGHRRRNRQHLPADGGPGRPLGLGGRRLHRRQRNGRKPDQRLGRNWQRQRCNHRRGHDQRQLYAGVHPHRQQRFRRRRRHGSGELPVAGGRRRYSRRYREHAGAGPGRSRPDHHRGRELHGRSRHAREQGKRRHGFDRQHQRRSHRERVHHRQRDRRRAPDGEHRQHCRRRRLGLVQLPMVRRRAGYYRRHRRLLHAGPERSRRHHHRQRELHGRPRHAREPDQHGNGGGGEPQPHAERRRHHLRHGDSGCDSYCGHRHHRRRRRPGKLQLPVAFRRPGHRRRHRQHLPADGNPGRTLHRSRRQVHRRQRRRGKPDQRGHRPGRQPQRSAGRQRHHHRHADPGQYADRQQRLHRRRRHGNRQLSMAGQRLRHNRCHRQHAGADGRPCHRNHHRSRQLYRRPRHPRVQSQLGDGRSRLDGQPRRHRSRVGRNGRLHGSRHDPDRCCDRRGRHIRIRQLPMAGGSARHQHMVRRKRRHGGHAGPRPAPVERGCPRASVLYGQPRQLGIADIHARCLGH